MLHQALGVFRKLGRLKEGVSRAVAAITRVESYHASKYVRCTIDTDM
jgi:hypothetical protein